MGLLLVFQNYVIRDFISKSLMTNSCYCMCRGVDKYIILSKSVRNPKICKVSPFMMGKAPADVFCLNDVKNFFNAVSLTTLIFLRIKFIIPTNLREKFPVIFSRQTLNVFSLLLWVKRRLRIYGMGKVILQCFFYVLISGYRKFL